MNLYTLLSIYGDGSTGVANAYFMLGILIPVPFLYAFAIIVKKLGIFDGLFRNNARDWKQYYKDVVEGENDDTFLGRAAGKVIKKFDKDFEYGSKTEFGTEGKEMLKKRKSKLG